MRLVLQRLTTGLAVFGLCLMVVAGTGSVGLYGDSAEAAQSPTEGRGVDEPSPLAGNVPGGHLGATSDSQIWKAVRDGVQGTVSIPDKLAGQMVQSEGDNWRARRNGPITVGGIWAIFGMLAFMALFFAWRGRIRIAGGPSGKTIERFNDLERFAHWLSATCFLTLALTGLNMLYGKHVLLPVLGPEAFAVLAQLGKYVHNFVSFGFMAGVVLMFVIWVRYNFPTKYDLVWIAKGGGLLKDGVHVPSEKFNAGQKMQFWLVVVGGTSLSLTGLALLFPFTFVMWDPVFSALNVFGFGLPTGLTPMDEMHLSQIWHGIIALVLIAAMISHIYIGSLGMEGAFSAMGTGQVDEKWAREHHDLWVQKVKGAAPKGAVPKGRPAE
jgi:formate dehydrogenase subunit gamma